MNQRVVLSPFTKLKLRAIAFLGGLLLLAVLALVLIAAVVDWMFG